MKTTICTDSGARLIVSPSASGEKVSVGITVYMNGMSVHLTPDQAGALIFGMESALEIMEIRRENAKREAYTAQRYAATFEANANKVEA